MQLTSKGANMVVDFYPVKFADGEISTRYILKTVTFMGKSQSKRYILTKDFRREILSCGGLWLRSDRLSHLSSTLQFCDVSCLLMSVEFSLFLTGILTVAGIILFFKAVYR